MKLKIALIGTGGVACSNYAPFLSKQPDVELLYYSRTLSKAEACARQFGGTAFESLPELCKRDPDAVLILTRETQRYEATLDILAHKPKRIFFEKPLVAQKGQAGVTEDDFTKGQKIMKAATELGIETSEFGRMLELYRHGLRLQDLISHHYPFKKAAAAFEKFVSGQSAKVFLDFNPGSGVS